MPRTHGARTLVTRRKPRARDRLWQSMRMLPEFTLPDLVATAETSYDNAKKYVRGLERAGYLRRAREKRNGRKGGHAAWRLVRDTGPRAPRLCSDGTTWDMNERKRYEGGIRQ